MNIDNRSAVVRDVRIPVSLAPGAGDQWIFGRLSRPAGEYPRTVQLLVPGLSYTAEYWRGHGDSRYDYEAFMLQAGYATLAIDRLGVFRSSHPPSTDVTFDNHVSAISEVAEWLRGQEPFGPERSFESVVLVGHSYGTVTGRAVAATCAAISGFAATAHAHSANTDVVTAGLAAHVIAARDDAHTREQVPCDDDGYLTGETGTRAAFFYDSATVDPEVLVADENAKSTGTIWEFDSITAAEHDGDGYAKRVRLPVLTAVGQQDAIFAGPAATDCTSAATLYRAQREFYCQADLTAYVQAGSGHNINLHRPAHEFFAAVLCWLSRYFPADDRYAPRSSNIKLYTG